MTSDKLEKTLGEVEKELQGSPEPDEPESKPEKRSKKVAKKLPKKGAKKVEKRASKTNGSTEGKITLSQLASEAGITGASARRKLREAECSREGRWAWDEGSKALREARKALGLEG